MSATVGFENTLLDGLVRATNAGTLRVARLPYHDLVRLGIHPTNVPGPTFWPFGAPAGGHPGGAA